MLYIENPDLGLLLDQLISVDREKFYGSTIPDLIALVDRELPKLQALRILNQAWAELYQEMDDEPGREELDAWRTLLHARDYLEARP